MGKGLIRMSKSHINYQFYINKMDGIISSIPEKAHIKVHDCYNINRCHDKVLDINLLHHYVLLYVLNGTVTISLNDDKKNLEQGSVLFASTGYKLKIKSVDPASKLTIIRFNLYSNCTNELLSLSPQSFWFSMVPGRMEHYRSLFQNILGHYHVEKLSFNKMICSVATAHLIGELYHTLCYRKNNTLKIDDRLFHAKLTIDSNPCLNISVEELAVQIDLSPKYFIAIFKQTFGLTPKRYMLNKKMNYAEFLLKSTKTSVKEVGLIVGYSDAYTFSKQFKKAKGYCPSVLLKK